MTSLTGGFWTGFKRGAEKEGGTVKDMGARLLSMFFWGISLLLSGVIVSHLWNTIATIYDLPLMTPLIGTMVILLSHLIFQMRIRTVGYSDEFSFYFGEVVGAYFALPLILWIVSLIALFIF